MIDNKDKLYALIEQCKSIDSKITSYHVMSSRVLGISIAIVSGILAIAIKEKNYFVLLVLPLFLYSIFFYWINIVTWIVSQGGYKKYLEEKINIMCEEPLFLWEAGVVQKMHINISNICLNILYIIVLILSIGSSIFAASKFPNLFVLSISINLVLIIVLLISYVNMLNVFDRTYSDSKKVEEVIRENINNKCNIER